MATAKTKADASAAPKKTAAKKAVAPSGTGRPKGEAFNVSATGNGTTNVRPTSFRGQVLAAIAATKKISTAELDAKMGKPTLGEVRTLEKLGHVATVA